MTTGTARTDAVLAAIDGALGDYDTSADAMRWTPDLPAVPSPIRHYYQDVFRMTVPSRVFLDATLIFDSAAFRDAVVRAVPVFRRLAEVVKSTHRSFEEAGLYRLLAPPPKRVELARDRRVASMMRRRDRRATKRRPGWRRLDSRACRRSSRRSCRHWPSS